MQIDLCFTIYMFVANLIELRIKDIIRYKTERYYKAFESSKDINLIDRCKQFINTETFKFPKESNNLRFDAYTDLSIFKNILKELKEDLI